MAAEKKNTALATVDSFQIVTGMEGMDEDLLAELEDEMDDLDDVKGISCRHIKIPSGGGKAYEVEGDDPDDPDIEKEIEAVIIFTHRMKGWRSWGNYTGAYPSSGDAKDIWIAVRRMFNWHGNTFIQTYFDKVDDPMNTKLIENVVDSENIRTGAYAPEYWAGASMEYRKDDNPTTDILAGKMTFRQHIAPYTPAQEINNVLSYDTDMLAAALGGE